MLDTAAQLLENWHRPINVRPGASGQPEQLAFSRWAGAAAHGTFDECAALLRHRRAQRLHCLRAYRAHVDYEFSGKSRLKNAVRAAVDCFAGIIIEQHHDNDLAALDELRR